MAKTQARENAHFCSNLVSHQDECDIFKLVVIIVYVLRGRSDRFALMGLDYRKIYRDMTKLNQARS